MEADVEELDEIEPTIDIGANQIKRQALDSLFARAMSGLYQEVELSNRTSQICWMSGISRQSL